MSETTHKQPRIVTFTEVADICMYHMIYISEKLARSMSELDVCFFLFWNKEKKSAIFGSVSECRLPAFTGINALIAYEQKTNGKIFFSY